MDVRWLRVECGVWEEWLLAGHQRGWIAKKGMC